MSSQVKELVDKMCTLFEEVVKHKSEPTDREAEVLRDNGDELIVHIKGGYPETPVKKTIDAKKGDKVMVRVADGKAWLSGNDTHPPTDDTVAKEAKQTAGQAVEIAEEADKLSKATADEAEQTIQNDTLHYLATSMSSGVTTNTPGWTTTIQTITVTNKYLWTYHTYTLVNGNTVDTTPIITGVYGNTGPQGEEGEQGPPGEDGSSVTILGSYDTLAELEAAHPTGSLGDAYLVAGDLYVWNGSAWEDVGQIQGPQGVSVTAVQPQYYLSTSPSSTTGGSWGNTLTWSSGYYIWTREQVTYSAGSPTYSTAIYDQALTTACSLAYGTAQYIWQQATGTTDIPTGQYVTEYPKSEYTDVNHANYCKGGALLLRSAGLYLRQAAKTLLSMATAGLKIFEPTDGTNPVLQALSSGVIVGKETGYHIVIGGNEVSFYKDANTMLFTISLSQYGSALKQSSSNSDGALYLTDKAAQLEVYEEASVSEYHTAYTEHRIHNSSATTDIQANWHGTSASTQHVAHVVLDANAISGRAQISATDELLLSSASMKFRGGKLFNTFTATGTVSLGANAGGNVTVSGTVPTGYTPIAVQGIESQHNQSALIGKFTLTSTGASISMRNVSNTSYSNMTVTATILCINSTFV